MGLSGLVPVMRVGYEGRAWVLGAWVVGQKLHDQRREGDEESEDEKEGEDGKEEEEKNDG